MSGHIFPLGSPVPADIIVWPLLKNSFSHILLIWQQEKCVKNCGCSFQSMLIQVYVRCVVCCRQMVGCPGWMGQVGLVSVVFWHEDTPNYKLGWMPGKPSTIPSQHTWQAHFHLPGSHAKLITIPLVSWSASGLSSSQSMFTVNANLPSGCMVIVYRYHITISMLHPCS